MTELFCSSPEGFYVSGVRAMFLTPFFMAASELWGCWKSNSPMAQGLCFRPWSVSLILLWPWCWGSCQVWFPWLAVGSCFGTSWLSPSIGQQGLLVTSQTFLMDQPPGPSLPPAPDLWLIMDSHSSCWSSSGIVPNLCPTPASGTFQGWPATSTASPWRAKSLQVPDLMTLTSMTPWWCSLHTRGNISAQERWSVAQLKLCLGMDS